MKDPRQDRLGGKTGARAGSCLDLAGDLAGVLTGPADLSWNARHLKGYGRRDGTSA